MLLVFFWGGRAEEGFPERETFHLSLDVSPTRRMGGKSGWVEGTAWAKTLRSGHGSCLQESAYIQRVGESGVLLPHPQALEGSVTMTGSCIGMGMVSWPWVLVQWPWLLAGAT